jgi:non-specific serine/threonine protein kinase
VASIVAVLERAGIVVWLDQRGIAGGANYAEEITRAIKGATALLICCTPASLVSRNVKQEIALAWRYALPLIPLRLDPVTIPDDLAYWLEAAQWMDVLDRPEATWLPPLLAALKRVGIAPVREDAAYDAPAAPRHNLPRQLTSFVGRENAVAEVVALVREHQFVTLTGVGGTGKTRLALAVAERLLTYYRDGCWLVELAALTDPALVAQAVAGVLGMRELLDNSVEQSLGRAIGDQETLLVLDNCEHLLDASARLAEALLRHCPHLCILATSREALGVPGEAHYQVPSLALPPGSATPDAATLAESEAVRLFVERSQASQPRFVLTDANAPLVAQVCARLDGIPLALELAAARLRVLSVEQLAQRLDDRFRLLTGGSRTALPRQQTLQATIDWSYRLLEEDERILLRRLSVFAGGWALDAAEAVCAAVPLEGWQILDLLTNLTDKSLILVETSDDQEPRYRLLETVRQYARERLLDADDVEILRRNHAAWALALAERLSPLLRTHELPQAQAQLLAEHENIRQALSWHLDHDPDRGLHLAVLISQFWFNNGSLSEGRRWLAATLARAASDAPARGEALARLGTFAGVQGDLAAGIAALAEGRAFLARSGDGYGESSALQFLCFFEGLRCNLSVALSLGEEAVALATVIGDEYVWSESRYQLARVQWYLGDFAAAHEGLNAIIAVYERLGIKNQGIGWMTLGEMRTREGDLDAAHAAFQSARYYIELSGDGYTPAFMLPSIGDLETRRGDYPAALQVLTEARTFLRATGQALQPGLTEALTGLVNWRLGAHRQALANWREALDQVRSSQLVGWVLSFPALVAIVASEVGEHRVAAQLLSAVERHCRDVRLTLAAVARPDHIERITAARSALGDEFDAAWSAGEALTLPELLHVVEGILAQLERGRVMMPQPS